MPVMGAPMLFTFENALGNMLPSAADFAVEDSVNCQPEQRAQAGQDRQHHDDGAHRRG